MDEIINKFILSCVNEKLKHLERKNALNKIKQKVDRKVKKNNTPVSNKKTFITNEPKNTKNNASANFNVVNVASRKTISPKDNGKNGKIPNVHRQLCKQTENFHHNLYEYNFDNEYNVRPIIQDTADIRDLNTSCNEKTNKISHNYVHLL